MNHKTMKRRNFIKTVPGITVLSILSLKKLFSKTGLNAETKEYLSNQKEKEEKIPGVFLEYGGEFSGIKPQLRRTNHGRI